MEKARPLPEAAFPSEISCFLGEFQRQRGGLQAFDVWIPDKPYKDLRCMVNVSAPTRAVR